MGEDPHLKLLKGVLSLVLEICSLAREGGVRAIRYAESNVEKDDVKEGDMEGIISGFANGGGTYVDAAFVNKVSEPFIVGSRKNGRIAIIERPILVMIITDSIVRFKFPPMIFSLKDVS